MSGVRTFRQYLTGEGIAHYSDHFFCESCDRLVKETFGSVLTPDDLDGRGSFPFDGDREYEHISYCPWCGVALEDEWWRETIVENERAIDHYDCPGTHKGDTHEFRGSSPDCMARHILVTTDPSFICWCDPTVEPDILGCRIIHNDVPPPENSGRDVSFQERQPE